MKRLLKNAAGDSGNNNNGHRRIAAGNGHGRLQLYGSRELPKEIHRVAGQAVRTPEPDWDHLRATAIASGFSGEPDVRDYATRTFNATNSELEEECRRLSDLITGEEAGAGRQTSELSRLLGETDRYQELVSEGVPWNLRSRIEIWFFILLSLLLLGVGINTNAVILMSSGISGFESPWRAYLFSLIPIGIAAALKVPGSHMEQRGRKKNYTLAVWGLGLFFGLCWATMFSSIFSGMTQSTADIVRSLAEPDMQSGGHSGSGTFVLIAILAEAFLAAGCWLTSQMILEKHQPSARHDNPSYLKVQKDLDHWRQRLLENRRLAAVLTGKIRAIDEARRSFVESCVGYFRAAVKRAENDRHLDDYLNR